MYRIIVCAFVALSLTACSTVRVPVTVTHPAEVNMTKYKEMAFSSINGNSGSTFSASLKDTIAESNKFKLVDRQHFDALMKEQNLSVSDLSKPGSVSKMGKLLPASVIIAGDVNSSYKEENTRSNGTCYKNKQAYSCTHYERKGQVDISGSIDFIDVASGELVKSLNQKNSCTSSTSATDGTPENIDKDSLKNYCIDQNVTKIKKAIMPWKELVHVSYLTDRDLPDLERGINQLKIGQNDKAISLFLDTIKNAENNPKIPAKKIAKAYFNLGQTYTYSDEFNKADEALKQAYSLDSNNKYSSAINYNSFKQKESIKLTQQLASSLSN